MKPNTPSPASVQSGKWFLSDPEPGPACRKLYQQIKSADTGAAILGLTHDGSPQALAAAKLAASAPEIWRDYLATVADLDKANERIAALEKAKAKDRPIPIHAECEKCPWKGSVADLDDYEEENRGHHDHWSGSCPECGSLIDGPVEGADRCGWGPGASVRAKLGLDAHMI
jgi:hypothetical protein